MARRPNAAQKKQIDELLATIEPQIRDAFIAAIYGARGRVNMKDLIDALSVGNVARAVELVQISQAALFPLEEAVRQGYIAGAFTASTALPRGMRASFEFNGQNTRAASYLANIGSTMIQDIRDATNEASRDYLLERMRQVTERGQTSTATLRSVAQEITGKLNKATGRRDGGVLGLTRQQSQYVLNSRADLENLDKRYFTRAQRDTRFDAMVRRSIASGKPLSRDDIDKITGRYNDRLLRYRGQVIARNEAFTAQASGRNEAMLQIGERADIERVEKRWQHTPAAKDPREDHIAMSGTVLPVDEPFVFADARMMFPHDPDGGASHSIGCRCIAVYRAVPVRD